MNEEIKAYTLHRTEIWKGSVGSFGIETVSLPNGKKAELAILKHPGAAAVVPFLDHDRVLLIRQYRHAVGGMIWEVPAGKLDRQEDPATCVKRELLEETGYHANRLEQTGMIYSTPGFSDERLYLFCAYDLYRGKRALEDHEVIETHEVRLNQALAMVDRGEIVDAKSIAALFHVVRRMQVR
ncbi:MAG: NUDIX hydrolase [Deltaproteobacteria bacterium]|nr:NUDIX hydrolase [Deltaproteobacteria bacterium]